MSHNMPAFGVSWAGCALLLACLSASHALYFHIGETEKKCFIEEIPDETMVIGKYRTQLWDKQTGSFLPSTPGLGMHVEIKDPDTKIVLSRQYGSEGRFTFTSHTPGEHQICLHSNSTKMALFAGGKLRVHLDIQVGEHTNNYPEIAAKDKLTELQLRVRQLLDQVDQIQKEQNYQRYREERFRMTSESTNQRVLWWSITQTIILLITGVWQMRHLKSFFEAKKLVHWSHFSGTDGRMTFHGTSAPRVFVLQGLQAWSDLKWLVGNQTKHYLPITLYGGSLTPMPLTVSRLQLSVLCSESKTKPFGLRDNEPFSPTAVRISQNYQGQIA